MTIEYTAMTPTNEMDNDVLGLKISGKLDTEDYEDFVTKVEHVLQEHDSINLFVKLEDFEGWTAGALWEDTKFALKHFKDIDRMAIVGGRTFEKNMARFVQPFVRTEVKFFEPDEVSTAQDWIQN